MDLLGSAEIATEQEHPTTQGQGYQGKIHSDPNICHIGQAEELEKIGEILGGKYFFGFEFPDGTKV